MGMNYQLITTLISCLFVCWCLTSLCHSNGHIETSHIDKENTKVSYELLDQVVDIVVNCGRSALVAKGDIKNVFRILPINPERYHLLGFK